MTRDLISTINHLQEQMQSIAESCKDERDVEEFSIAVNDSLINSGIELQDCMFRDFVTPEAIAKEISTLATPEDIETLRDEFNKLLN